MKGQIFFFLIVLFACSLAQHYHWGGEWKIWDIVPGTHIGRCCKPSTIKITEDTKHPNLLHFFMKIPPQPECPHFSESVVFTEKVSLGRFHDTNPNSTLRGIKGEFHPNNNTIVISPGPLGTCKWILGSDISIKTNDTDSNRAMNWEGPWVIDEIYKGVENANCCVPLTPLIVKEDFETLTVNFNAFYPDQAECAAELRNRTLAFNFSVRYGSFDTGNGTVGYYFPNATVLTEKDGCIMLYNRWRPNKTQEIHPRPKEFIAERDLDEEVNYPDESDAEEAHVFLEIME